MYFGFARDGHGLVARHGLVRAYALLIAPAIALAQVPALTQSQLLKQNQALKPLPKDTAELADRAVKGNPQALKLRAAQSEVILTQEAWAGRPVSLADVLAEQAGIETRRYGGVGSFQTVSMRGSTAARVQVLLDDVPLNSAGGGPVDLGKLDLGVIERIEAVKGMVPAEDGGNGMGGVVRLYTKGHSQGTGSAQVSLGAGSHGTRRHSFSAQTPASRGGAKISALVNAAITGSDNDFRYLDRNATPYNLNDDAWVTRRNSEYAGLTGNALVRFDALGGGFRLKVAHDRHSGGLPGREGEVTTTAGHFLRHTQYLVGYVHGDDQTPGAWRHTVEAASDEETPGMHWTRGEPIGWPSLGDTVRLYTRSRRDRLIVRAGSGPLLSAAHPIRLSLFAALAREALEPWGDKEGSLVLGWRNGRDEASVAGDAVWTLLRADEDKSTLNLIAAGHLAHVSEHTEGAHLPLGGDLRLGESNAVHASGRMGLHGVHGQSQSQSQLGFYANAGSYYHLPSLSDRYGGRFGVVANPSLRPERALHLETGLRWAFARGYAEAGLFRHATEDALFYSQVANLIKAYNLDAALVHGLELHLECDLVWGLKFFGSSTLQKTRNLSDTYDRGKRLPNQPGHNHTSRLAWNLPLPLHFNRVFGLSLDYRYELSGDMYRDPSNLTLIPAQSLHHAGAQARMGAFGVHAAFQNLGDVFYEDAYGSYPYPGRQYLLTVTYRLP